MFDVILIAVFLSGLVASFFTVKAAWHSTRRWPGLFGAALVMLITTCLFIGLGFRFLYSYVFLGGLIASVFIVRATQDSARRWPGRFGAALIILVTGCLLLGLGYRYWYFHRTVPPATRQTLFQGVTYIREVRNDPRPMLIHVLLIDLNTPGIGFLVTPPQANNGSLQARATSQFLTQFGVQLAINGADFRPWQSVTLLDYYPRVGDPVNVVGFASSQGLVYSRYRSRKPTLYLSADNKASFQRPVGAVYNALSGMFMLLQNGKPVPLTPDEQGGYGGVQPRTVVALDKDARTLILIVVDGRQPNFSEGATLEDLIGIALDYGADTAMNQDGGGSSTMVMQGETGEPVLLNSPIDSYIPGRERAIGNHLGIFARPLES